jgi:hypothetical protein
VGRLVKTHNGEVAIAWNYVATPDYTLYVNDYAGGATPPHGWVYFADDVTHEDFAPEWKQPTGPSDAYPLGFIVAKNGARWRSTIAGNVWEPGVSGWQDADSDVPSWIQPTGAHDAYIKEALVKHNSKLWLSLLDANVWEPGVANWREAHMIAPPDVPVYSEWVQPTGAGDAYPLDAIVLHNGHTWRSDYAANVWEPGVFGWTQIA